MKLLRWNVPPNQVSAAQYPNRASLIADGGLDVTENIPASGVGRKMFLTFRSDGMRRSIPDHGWR